MHPARLGFPPTPGANGSLGGQFFGCYALLYIPNFSGVYQAPNINGYGELRELQDLCLLVRIIVGSPPNIMSWRNIRDGFFIIILTDGMLKDSVSLDVGMQPLCGESLWQN